MFKIEDKTIYVTRGDKLIINEADLDIDTTSIIVDDYVVFRLYNKKKLNELPLLEKKVIVEEDHKFSIELSKDETKIGELLNKPSTYWYEVEVNGENTVVGYDQDGAKLFILYPEGDVEEPIHEHEFGEYVYDSNSGMEISHCNGCDETMERAHEHTFGDRTYDDRAGVDIIECSVCGEIQELAHEHRYSEWQQNDENEHKKECIDCSQPYIEPHNFVDMGEYEECSECGYQKQKIQHTHNTATKYEGHTNNANSICCYEVVYCTDPSCGEEISRVPIEHDWVEKNSTFFSVEYGCRNCSATKEVDKEEDSHIHTTSTFVVEGSYTNDANSYCHLEHDKCTVEGCTYSTDPYEVQHHWFLTGSTMLADEYTCEDCSATKTEYKRF